MNDLVNKLNAVEKFARGSRLSRLAHNPFRYIKAMILGRFVYRFTHKGSLQTASLFFGGDMQVLLPAATDIFLSGAKTHESETRLARYMLNNLQPGHTFLDIGAHFGYFTLLASELVGQNGVVYSIEAAKSSFGLLKENVAAKKNIHAFYHAVSDKNEIVNFYEFPVQYSEYNALDIEKFEQQSWIKNNNPEQTTVQAVTIDVFLQDKQLKPSMIKIDVEGAEVQVLAGAAETLHGDAVIILEYLDEGDDSSYTKAADLLYEYGYNSYMIDKQGGLTATQDILSFMRGNNMTSENVVFKKR